MNWDRNWKQLTGNVQRQFGKLIDGQLDLWEGKRDRPKQGTDGWITTKVPTSSTSPRSR
jgi:hypothetical protein